MLLVLALLVFPATAKAQSLTVSTAASLREAFAGIGRAFEKAHPGARVRFNLASSGTLQRQIEQGAPVDIFASAGLPQMDALERLGLLMPGSRRTFATNRLALIAPNSASSSVKSFDDLASAAVTRLALGDPRWTPAGRYAKEALRHLGLWARLRPKLIYTIHVRQAIEYVMRGEVDAALVYATDARLARDRIHLVALADEAWHRPIRYPIAVLKESRRRNLAMAFVDLVTGSAGRAELQRFGFGTLQ